jgi:hypothetical protein
MTEHRRSKGRFLPTYATLVGLPALALLVILRIGATAAPANRLVVSTHNPASASAATAAQHVVPGPVPDLPLLLAQIIVILIAARLVGALVRRLGQPQVVGEMLAGIALGPSLLGAQAQRVAALLFPASSLGFKENGSVWGTWLAYAAIVAFLIPLTAVFLRTMAMFRDAHDHAALSRWAVNPAFLRPARMVTERAGWRT